MLVLSSFSDASVRDGYQVGGIFDCNDILLGQNDEYRAKNVSQNTKSGRGGRRGPLSVGAVQG